jgi:ATP-dependent DNA helicase RecQ
MPEPCGHCANCARRAEREGRGTESIPEAPAPELTEDHTAAIHALLREKHAPLRTPRQLARFLCGLTSPATTRAWHTPAGTKRRARLVTHDAFALVEDHPFAEVLAYCECLIIP